MLEDGAHIYTGLRSPAVKECRYVSGPIIRCTLEHFLTAQFG